MSSYQVSFHKISKLLGALLVVAVTFTLSSAAVLMKLPDGAKVDLTKKCPVCGMIVGGKEGQGISVVYKGGQIAKFFGVAATVFNDGKVIGFDGARCLFVFNSVPTKYGADSAEMKHQYVTDLVSKNMIDVEKAFLVLGSDVKGRMGYEMIPFRTKREASKFAAEHDGKWIIQLHTVVHGNRNDASETPIK